MQLYTTFTFFKVDLYGRYMLTFKVYLHLLSMLRAQATFFDMLCDLPYVKNVST